MRRNEIIIQIQKEGWYGPLDFHNEDSDQFEKATSLQELCRATRQCRKGVSRKASATEFYLTRLTSCKRLRDDLLAGRYKPRKGKRVFIFRPKKREATAPWFRDRVWQRSMVNNGVYRDLTRSLIYDNMACQKNKGTDLAIRRVVKMLQKICGKYTNATIYVMHRDVKKYFPSTPQALVKQMDEEKVTEKRFLPHLHALSELSEDNRPENEIAEDPFGRRGTDLGSTINQLNQVAFLDKLDHELKTRCKCYIRYNDDFLIIDINKEVLKWADAVIEDFLNRHGLTMTRKGWIEKVTDGFLFLRKRFHVTRKGKIVIKMYNKALTEERKLLRAFKRMIKRGWRTMEDVRVHYQCWVAFAEYAGDGPIAEMDKYYTKLFREHPKYKRKKRYLYGNHKNCNRKAA